jgi:hypothetical protein
MMDDYRDARRAELQSGRAPEQRAAGEAGVALVTALLIMMLVGGLIAGTFAAVNADLRSHAIDRDQTQVYAAAHAGLEKLTADLAALFTADFSPDAAQLDALTASSRLPAISGFEYTAPGGSPGSGYAISWTPDANGNPLPLQDSTITAGPYAGFKGILTRYDITVTARSATGSEMRLRRGIQTVAVPVFQFGVFSDTDLSFYGGDSFDFGGRVHTNGNLWLSEAYGSTLLFTDRITAYGDVNRKFLSNRLDAAGNGMSGAVRILTAIGNPSSARTLRYSPNESSVTNSLGGFWTDDDPPVWNANGATTNNGSPSWTTVSQSYYKGNLVNRHTGATVLRLPLVSMGARPIDLIRRPAVGSNEDTANPPVFGQRYFGPLAGLRILLSDRPEDLTGLPTVTSTPPVALDGDWLAAPPAGYGPVDAMHPPIARSIGPASNVTTTGSTYSAPYAQIAVSGSIDPTFLAPSAMTVTSSLGTATVTNCTGRTATTFTGCELSAPGLAADGTLSATLPSGLGVSAATTLAAGSGSGVTITLSTTGTPQPTAPFAPGLIWVNGTAVTCEGYAAALSPQRFSNCRGLTAAPASGQAISTHAVSAENKGLVGGYLKVEQQTSGGVWNDVTTEILNLGFGAANQEGADCGDPTPNAVLRLQRLRDNGSIGSGSPICTYGASQNAHDWWPNGLYDAREGNYRPGVSASSYMKLGGIVQYVALDVNNLRRWLAGDIGASGPNTVSVNGYIVYFSDRRGDHDESVPGDPETGEYGFEDVVNPASATGAQNATLDAGEDVNGNGVLDRHGETPHALAVGGDWSGFGAPFDASARPWIEITTANAPQARVNRQVLFRRALKLVNAGVVGGVSRLPQGGLTVASENPVYVHGNYNATNDPVSYPNEAHRPASIVADSVAILSNNWKDVTSFRFPNAATSRPAVTTGFRFAVVTGKSDSFPYPTAGSPHFLFGTDGGAGNFLRLTEDWSAATGRDINYRGAMVSLFISHQATGTFKYGSPHNVYDYADRNFKFDDEFLQPALLPPGTPMFRDVNLLTFRQILRPNQ